MSNLASYKNERAQSVAQARKHGYLVTGKGRSWLGHEVAWRRRCTAQGKPTVVVSRRSKLADVYMFLHKVPHSDVSDRELRTTLLDNLNEDVAEGQINIIRGTGGRPNLFIGLSVSSVSLETALALAPKFVHKARSLVKQKQS